MKKNMGAIDSFIRLLVSAIIATLYFTNIIRGAFALVLLIAAAVSILTAFFRFCPLYVMLHKDTCEAK